MRPLIWSQNKAGTLNGKVGPLTIFTVAFYPQRGYFLAPKLPGLHKTIPVKSPEIGMQQAEGLYRHYLEFLLGLRAFDFTENRKPKTENQVF